MDTYFIADELLRDKLNTDADIQATGIPVRQQFMIKHDKQKCREFFGWDENERVCLLMGGGEGLLPMAEIIAALQRAALKTCALSLSPATMRRWQQSCKPNTAQRPKSTASVRTYRSLWQVRI